jgi:hypothetical protein
MMDLKAFCHGQISDQVRIRLPCHLMLMSELE